MSDPRSLLFAIGATAIGFLVSIGLLAAGETPPRQRTSDAFAVTPLTAQFSVGGFPSSSPAFPPDAGSMSKYRSGAVEACIL